MTEYHKIHSIYKREDRGGFIAGEFSRPEFAYLYANQWTWTEKVDGTNIRVMWDGEDAHFGGRTDRAQMRADLYERLLALFAGDRRARLAEVFGESPAVLYGEGYGSGIQKGGNYKSDGVDFVLFDVRVDDLWLQRDSVTDIADRLELRQVPTLGTGSLAEAELFVAKGFDSAWGSFPAEGIVARPLTELRDRRGGRVITKLKTRDYA